MILSYEIHNTKMMEQYHIHLVQKLSNFEYWTKNVMGT